MKKENKIRILGDVVFLSNKPTVMVNDNTELKEN